MSFGVDIETISFIFKMIALSLSVTLIGLGTIMFYVWQELAVLKEAIATIVGSNPTIAKKVNELFDDRKKSNKGGEDGV